MTHATLTDARGLAVTGAHAAALEAYERAAAAFLHWREGAEAPLQAALDHAPAFAMAHVLAAWMRVNGRNPAQVRSARPHVERAAASAGTARECLHVAALRAALDDDLDTVRARLSELLREAPLDALALQMAHAFDHLTGDEAVMLERVEAVLPAWPARVPGASAVLAMHAFALGENGRYEAAEEAAHAALAIDPGEPRAHHALAHAFEMTRRPEAGIAWLREHESAWGAGSVVSTHLWWHIAVFELARGNVETALALYDRRIRAGRSEAMGDLIDAASLLWRVMLRGGKVGRRFAELSRAWAPHIGDAYCTFSDLHAMLAFVGAGHGRLARSMQRAVAESAANPASRHGASSRLIGVPAARALIAFGRGDDELAASLLAQLPPHAHRIGGSQAQRDVLQLTQMHALRRAAARRERVDRRSWAARIVRADPVDQSACFLKNAGISISSMPLLASASTLAAA